MQRIEFEVLPKERIEVHEVDNANKNIFVCPAQDFDDNPWIKGKKVIKYEISVEYEVIPILEDIKG